MKRGQNKQGFTIVELLIVIVVIGILAAITIVAFNGIQSQARDSERKQDLSSLSKVTNLYNVDKGDYATVNCGANWAGYEGSGWLSSDYDGAGPYISVNDCLINNKLLQQALIDPSGQQSCTGATCHAYMKASCSTGTWYFANLERLPQNSSFTDDKCHTSWDVDYGINYAVRVN